MKRLVIDTDPSIDDAHTIMLATANPQAKVEALTTVVGNVNLENTTANALITLDMLGADIHVYPGSADTFKQVITIQ